MRAKKITAWLLAAGLLVTTAAAPVHAVEKISTDPTKEESVYVKMDADGEVKEITATDVLKNIAKGKVKDQSDLEEIENVKGNETFIQNGENLTWDSAGDDIHYQGTVTKELPVEMNISYKLDGKQVSAKELAGKSGAFEMTVTYQNHDRFEKTIRGKKETFYTPFFLLTMLVLDNEKFKNVTLSSGKLIEEDDSTIVAGYGVPGLYDSLGLDSKEVKKKLPEHFTLKAEVTDFSLPSTTTYATPSLMGSLKLDDSSELNDMEDGLDDLVDGSGELVKGSQKLDKAVGTFVTSFSEYASGEAALNKGIKALVSGGASLKTGVNSYVDGTTTLAKGLKSYVKGAKQISDGNTALYEAVKSMPAGYQTFSTGLNSYTKAVDTLAAPETKTQLVSGSAAVASEIGTMHDSVAALLKTYDGYDAIITGLKQQAAATSDAAEQQALLTCAGTLEQLVTAQKNGLSAVVSATDQTGDLKKGADSVAAGVSTVMDAVSAISQNSESLRSADSTMSSSIAALSTNAAKLKTGAETLTANNKKLTKGANALIRNKKTMKQGVAGLYKGLQSLKSGSNAIHKATKGVTLGFSRLKQGTTSLAGGMKTFDQKGIHALYDVYTDEVLGFKNRLNILAKRAKAYDQFTGLSEEMDGSVTFILTTEKIEK